MSTSEHNKHIMSDIAVLRSNDGSDIVSIPHVEYSGKLVSSTTATASYAESIAVVSAVHKHTLAAISALQAANPSDEKESRRPDGDDDEGGDEFEEGAETDEPAEKLRRIS
ncbi:Hypothetical protein, putative [Bodo saltans]|uniref:Uncharacterized protein n=1 Tax=Bodo saltans TaxID=75058 RepID=A0A0S4KLT3_BODSA|nr:Hypothetical protein, putative [Bodo saltans]|eukprot:CUI15582.1 Hypothetical protein, putative [Bodo saltans]